MSSSPDAPLPDVAAVLAQVLQSIPREQQPLLIAAAERLAAARYRAWGHDPAMVDHRVALLACAGREEEIAARIEALHPDGAALQRELVAQHPQLAEINRTLFDGRPLAVQFAIQARGERLGAATWRAFAAHAPSPEVRDTFLACASLEEESAALLESLGAGGTV